MNAQQVPTIFAFDWSTASLVYPGPDGRPASITVDRLRELGWNATEHELRIMLPRFDRSRLATPKPPPGMVST